MRDGSGGGEFGSCAGAPAGAGSISRLPSGSLRVRVYVGVDPVTGRQGYLSETVGAGPTARVQAEEACRRLLGRVQRRRCMRTDATVNEVLDRHLALLHCTERTRESYEYLPAGISSRSWGACGCGR